MRRLLQVLVLLGLLSAGGAQANPPPMELTQQELDWIAANPVLRVGVFENLLPFEYISGDQLRGLSAKYLRLIAQRTGLHFKSVVTTTRSARKDMLISGEVDILPTRRRSDNPAEDRGILYTLPYNTSSTILISRVGEQPFADLEQLAGKRLAMLGREEDHLAFLHKKAPGIMIISAQNAVDMMAMVKDGRADAAIASEWLLIPYLSRQYQGVLQISGVVPQLHTGVSMAVRDSDPILLAILQKALASISGDERKAIYDAWFADMNLDIPSIKAIAEHYQSELWLMLAVVVLLLALVWQSQVQRRRAVRSERDKAMFLAIMSHEIRSPMNAVLAAVELLQHTPLDEQQRHFTDLANNGSNTLLRLVGDVLDISKMEAGQLRLNLESVEVWALLQRVVDDHLPYAEEKGLELRLTGEGPIAPLLLDGLRLAQVVRNLISNAIKFTDVGRVEVQLLLLDGPLGDPRHLLIRVVDSGIGLSEQGQASLFRPYARAKHSYRRTGGTGLGLVICRRLVKLMHGELTLSSTLGTGTQVEVMLPVEWAPLFDSLEQPSAPFAEPVQGPVASNGLRALVVESTVINQHLLEEHLQGLGCEMLLAADAVQGLALFSAQKFDLVLMNCDLPGEDGYSLAGEFRELERRQQRPYCPIVAVSQVTGNEHLERCFDAGMDAVLNTPIDRDKLAQIIELWCEVTLVPSVQPLTAPVHKLEAGREALRKELSGLLEAVALRDRSLALQAAGRLHGAALVIGWTGIATAVETIEPLLRDEMNWPAEAIAGHLSILVELWADLNY
ncbi:transporter substrate-binding domain-containing protein [Pseudomonas sp. ADAK18]|uniref:ATP-binding protein n=1 Tax=Pseudomonas sp. ADAK18 TaxID=2730848 RepID=UPI001463897A|nr:transporter substrate-binding domain-containing protein [Pseudomonas sp. ADAK18]QJI30304.1 transporter substrate-binding domain-containing protein [Pseudomonas sp. ADAK18]